MVKETSTLSPDRALALSYAPAETRAGLEALFALDATLGSVLRTSREPMVGQMRLTWWFEALERLDQAPPPAQPALQALASEVLPRGVTGESLAAMVDGWEPILVEDAPGEDVLALFARERGGRLFAAAARVLGVEDARIGPAGEGWALADLAANLSDAAVAAKARAMAAERLARALGGRWPARARALGALALLARGELEGADGARRVGRMLWHRLTGL